MGYKHRKTTGLDLKKPIFDIDPSFFVKPGFESDFLILPGQWLKTLWTRLVLFV